LPAGDTFDAAWRLTSFGRCDAHSWIIDLSAGRRYPSSPAGRQPFSSRHCVSIFRYSWAGLDNA